MGLSSSSTLGHFSWHDVCEECDITLDSLVASSEDICEASWPLQAYIKGLRLPISHCLSLTYTSTDSCLLSDFSAPLSADPSSSPPPSTVNELTLKISGGTVTSIVNDIYPHRRLFRIHEAWERESD